MSSARTGFIFGLGLTGCLALAGLVWPIASGYLPASDSPGGERITDVTPKFDRTALYGELDAKGFVLGDKAHVRIFKREKVLELWLKGAAERFALFKSYP